MYFLQSVTVPIKVTIGDTSYAVPKFTLGDVVSWGNDIAQDRSDSATQGMDEFKKREHLNFYPPVPPDLTEMKAMIRSTAGIDRVCRTCLLNGKVPPDLVNQVMKSSGTGRLAGLAWVLADLDEKSVYQIPEPAIEETPADPSKPSATDASID